ncbi:MAG: iron-containing redox enzyme family protein [Alphaproteobacteria bacterium]
MATKTIDPKAFKELESELTELANDQFESDAYKRMLAAPYTLKGAQQFFMQHAMFNLNRRDCWGYVLAKSPLPVKKLVWEHEEEELDGVPHRGGLNHYELAVKQGETLGLTPEDYYNAQVMDGTYTCSMAWAQLAQSSSWLESCAASSALEYSNSDDIIREGALSRRMGAKLEKDLGIPIRKQDSNAEHMVAELEHAQLLLNVANMYGDTELAREQIVSGAKQSWAIDRVFRNFLGELLEQHAD